MRGLGGKSKKALHPRRLPNPWRSRAGSSSWALRAAGTSRAHGSAVVVRRQPRPYGALASQAVERFATYEDLDKYGTTIEEREEYAPPIGKGTVVNAGVDYQQIVRQAETEAEIL